MKPQEFCELVYPAIQVTAVDLGKKSQLMVLAHAGYETGWGICRAYRLGNNLFNITRLPSDPESVVDGKDMEYSPSGKSKIITQRFAAYPGHEESVTHYLQFISRPRYQPAYALLTYGDVAGFITTLRKGGYFTLPLNQYLAGFDSCLKLATDAVTQLEKS